MCRGSLKDRSLVCAGVPSRKGVSYVQGFPQGQESRIWRGSLKDRSTQVQFSNQMTKPVEYLSLH